MQEIEGVVFAVTNYPTNIYVISFGDLVAPMIIQQFPIDEMLGRVEDMIFLNDKVFAISSAGSFVKAYFFNAEITDGFFTDPAFSYAYDIVVKDNIVMLGQIDRGYALLDVTVPSKPKYSGVFGKGKVGTYFTRNGNYLYTLMGGLTIIDITDPQSPVELSRMPIFPHSLREIEFKDDVVYIADYSNGLIIVDVSDPYRPFEISRTDPPEGEIVSVSVQDRYIYCGARFGGLYIYDISDLSNPSLVSSLGDLGNVAHVEFIEDFVYVYPYSEPGTIVNVSVPTRPFIVQGDISRGVRDVAFVDDYAFMASQTEGLQVFDVEIPGEPKLLTNFPTPGWAENVTIANNHIYIADSYCGLFILSFGPIVNTSENYLYENELLVYPNPVADNLSIQLRLHEKANVRLEIFDELGRLTQVIFDGSLPGGEYTYIPGVSTMTSGKYFVRALVNSEILSEAVLMIQER
jgi:hypothetical protein